MSNIYIIKNSYLPMKITCITKNWEQINGTISKEHWIQQEAQWLHFYHFIQEEKEKIISWRIALDKNSDTIKNFQFKNNDNKEIFQLLDNITIDRIEGLCDELRWEKKPIVVI